ncbi:MAG: transcription-repair coupling factor [Rickettsiales bacterium]|nr:transcription-repair coupling factor [Rickettsiales bacterium]|tara:strand:+ start:2963 stop:6316 length:3354 start_codon:yes stop_codon:yes gene_type:complete
MKIEINEKKKINLYDDSIQIFLSLISNKKKVAFFTANHEEAIKLKNKIKLFDPFVEILVFPDLDCSFFSNVSPTKPILLERIKTLFKLITSKKKRIIFIGPINSLITKTIKKKNLNFFDIFDNSKNTYLKLSNFLKQNNYEFVDTVRSKGECCVRGQIIDIFSPLENKPARILYNFEEVETVNFFDIYSQNNCGTINNYLISPTSEIIFNTDSIKNFRETFRKFKIKDKDDFYKSISNQNIIPGSEQFYPILYNEYDSIIDYLDYFDFFFKEDSIIDFEDKHSKVIKDLPSYEKEVSKESNFFEDKNIIRNQIKKKNTFIFSKISNKSETYFFSEKLFFNQNKKENLKTLKNFFLSTDFEKIFFCYDSVVNKKNIERLYENFNIIFERLFAINDSSKKFNIINLSIDSSFILNQNNKKLLFLSDYDFFKKITKRKTSTEINDDNIISEFSQLNFGDLIVHIDHGVGKFNCLKKKKINDIEQEFIELLYHNNDKLLIPIENLELISKYGFSNANVRLDKLGLQNWQFKKATLKKKIRQIASDLINTAAKRKLIKSLEINPNKIEYEKFSSLFEFTETSDQMKAIEQIEKDFNSSKAMDRLICGDVGFGKTEIAMRAAFLVLSSGYQVAVICPKVLLVNQHFKTFIKRFNGFGYIIEKISRFEKIGKKKKIIEQLKLGLIDLIIGTHAILSENINFNKLGLIIIDEEQSFGVEQKEKLKKKQPNSHILTLTATPIPRTLQSSLLKMRDISLIKTPPLNRQNVKTYLMFYEDNLLKNLINKELERKGQIFFVTPRIKEIQDLEKKLKRNFPSINYSIIHSKLNAVDIEKIYNNFFEKKIDLLLSTAMIESGLDISNVNTIIINKPYLFGLSQLYQLRGRVGRSSIQAYAYLLLEKNTHLSEERLRRLQLISKIDSLGAGFSIAANDLDIRGAGNIVGSEQSGHIKEVGIELYYKMLNEAISELKNEKISSNDWSPIINLGFSYNIPDDYIINLDLRMQIYRKISGTNELLELKKIISNLEDRFGKFPKLFNNLFKIIEIKILCKKLNIIKIDNSADGFVFKLRNIELDYIDNLISLAKNSPEKIKLLPNSKLIYISKKYDNFERVLELKKFLESLMKNVK